MSVINKVLHCVPSVRTGAGGPSRTVVRLADSLASHSGVDVSLLTQGTSSENTVRSRNGAVQRIVLQSSSSIALKMGLPIKELLQHHSFINQFDIIHSHGVWLPVNHWAVTAALKYGIPLIIHPRGMLEPWALSHKSWKKRLAMLLFQRRDIESAAMLVATSDDEFRNIRSLGFKKPIAIIPNGVDLNVAVNSAEKLNRQNNIRTALFLSRVHKKKGLLNLIEAWAKVKPENWRLVIAGPDEGGHLADVIKTARAHGIEGLVDYIGEVDGENKSAVYQNADVFVLPTFSENFGVVVAEALAHGVPVITTKGAPWSDLELYNCGWWIDIGVEPLVNALRSAISLSDEDRAAMGRRGREYVKRYDWDDIARQTVEVYQWVLNRGPLPSCVHLD